MKEEKLTRLKILTECLQNSKRISYGTMSRYGLFEIEAYFIFARSTTLTENKWWRYAFKYREEYLWEV